MSDKEPLDLSPDHVARMIMLVYGLMSDSKPFWCFVAVKPSLYDHLKGLVAEKKLDLRTYVEDGFGEIVVSGEGVLPPNEVIKTISTMFNVPMRQLFADVDPNEEINKKIEELKKEFGEA